MQVIRYYLRLQDYSILSFSYYSFTFLLYSLLLCVCNLIKLSNFKQLYLARRVQDNNNDDDDDVLCQKQHTEGNLQHLVYYLLLPCTHWVKLSSYHLYLLKLHFGALG